MIKKIKLSLVAFFTTVILISIIGISYRSYQTRTTQVTLTNYSAFLKGKYRSEIQSTLFNVLTTSVNVEGKMVTGEIRPASFTALSDHGTVSTAFLVDIDAYRQTFLVSYSYPDPSAPTSATTVQTYNSAASSANSILISCPSKEKRKYPDSSCVGMFNTSAEVDALSSFSSLASALPIIVDDFDFASRTAIHYEILGHLNSENRFVITINDYSGSNESAAHAKISALLDSTSTPSDNIEILYYNLAQ